MSCWSCGQAAGHAAMCAATTTAAARERALAETVVLQVKTKGTITGLVGATVRTLPMTLHRLANYGVPANMDLPYDTNTLRDLVVELAQLEVD